MARRTEGNSDGPEANTPGGTTVGEWFSPIAEGSGRDVLQEVIHMQKKMHVDDLSLSSVQVPSPTQNLNQTRYPIGDIAGFKFPLQHSPLLRSSSGIRRISSRHPDYCWGFWRDLSGVVITRRRSGEAEACW